MKTDKELKQLAFDIYSGKVFTNNHLNETYLLSNVFMPLFFAIKEIKDKDIGMIYEYMSKAGSMSINGLPTFSSMQYITTSEADKVFEYLGKIAEMKNNFMEDK